MAEHRRELFPDGLFAGLFSGRGRRSVPASVIATVLVLQALEGLSDREAVERLECDVRWKAAAGLSFEVCRLGRTTRFSLELPPSAASVLSAQPRQLGPLGRGEPLALATVHPEGRVSRGRGLSLSTYGGPFTLRPWSAVGQVPLWPQ